MQTLYGVVHGKTIELNEAPGMPDGQAVAVTLQRVATANSPTKREELPRVEDWVDRLVFDSAITSESRVVKGTRLSAEALLGEMASGRTDHELLASHPELSGEDIEALRQYARLPQAFRLTFGAWADDGAELDQYVASLRGRHKRGRPEMAP